MPLRSWVYHRATPDGWRTAHNQPSAALLDAADRMGMLVWDENHRNGQPAEVEILVKRDRNHPSIVIWSLCNEVLCESGNKTGDGLVAEALLRRLDPLGQRPISAKYARRGRDQYPWPVHASLQRPRLAFAHAPAPSKRASFVSAGACEATTG